MTNKIGTDGANTFSSTIKTSVDDGFYIPIPCIISPTTFNKALGATISG